MKALEDMFEIDTDPKIVETRKIDGAEFSRTKPWKSYTVSEKAAAIARFLTAARTPAGQASIDAQMLEKLIDIERRLYQAESRIASSLGVPCAPGNVKEGDEVLVVHEVTEVPCKVNYAPELMEGGHIGGMCVTEDRGDRVYCHDGPASDFVVPYKKSAAVTA